MMGKRRRFSRRQQACRNVKAINTLLNLSIQPLREKRLQAEREEKEAKRAEREAARQKIQDDRMKKQYDKENQKVYLESRIEESRDNTKQLSSRMDDLTGILDHSLQKSNSFSFDSLRNKEKFRDFMLPENLKEIPQAPQLEDFVPAKNRLNTFEKLIPGNEERFRRKIQEAKDKYNQFEKQYLALLTDHDARIERLHTEYEKDKGAFDKEVRKHNRKVQKFEDAYNKGEPNAVINYCTMILEQSKYPDGFPQQFRVAFLPEPKELVIEYELPNKEIIPTIAEFRYVKSKDTISDVSRKISDIKDQYLDIVSSICLRTIHEVIEADKKNHILIVVFNGFVQTIDPATGNDIRPCLISIRVTKERFKEIKLDRIDKQTCLRNLGAQVSTRASEMQSVKPIIEFDMVDKRFVEQSDIMSDLESRPNLMDLNPFEFENLVSNLFELIGFEVKQTRTTKDSGVDAIAFDTRPILGGKVVIQAKRYKNVVGVSAVRDLYGTMMNEGANKGILVTTSHYGPDACEFAKNKPIEMFDGGGLLYLLEQQGVKARIIFPGD
jgi:restriction system protein